MLFISFKDAESETYDVAYAKLMTIIADACKSNSEISDNNTVDKDDLEVFVRLKAQKGTESDVPLAKASEKDTAKSGYYSKMLDVIKGIMSATRL